jgi:hypothetical protein
VPDTGFPSQESLFGSDEPGARKIRSFLRHHLGR